MGLVRRAGALLVGTALAAGCATGVSEVAEVPDDASGTGTPAVAGTVDPGDDPGRWQPTPGTTWQWQLQGDIDVDVEAEVFDVDLFEVPDEVLAQLRARGRRLVCYLNAGAHEPWRPDADVVDEAVLGRPLAEWPDERWFDVRRLDALEPLIEARVAGGARRGFDGVEFDNVDGYANETGFPLTAEDQLAYNRFLADVAHRHGLAAGLKNAVELVPELVDRFDFAVNEECAAYGECERLAPFIEQGKAVVHVEYEVPVEGFCGEAARLGLSSMRKRWELDAWRQVCPPAP